MTKHRYMVEKLREEQRHNQAQEGLSQQGNIISLLSRFIPGLSGKFSLSKTIGKTGFTDNAKSVARRLSMDRMGRGN